MLALLAIIAFTQAGALHRGALLALFALELICAPVGLSVPVKGALRKTSHACVCS